MEEETLRQKTTLSLREAAQVIATESLPVHEAEVKLIRAIERGELHANVKRWATEQWEGNQLPGNFNTRETFIERADLEAWQESNTAA